MIRIRALRLATFTLLAVPTLLAQRGPQASSGTPDSGGQNMKMMKHDGGDHGGMGIVPSGMWWKNPATVTALSLTADQQKRLDDIFLQSRISLSNLHASLDEEQSKLEPLLNANPPDQAKSLAQISKIADLRADLEKANAKMLLSLRGVLTADQWTKLQADMPTHHDSPGGDGRGIKGGPDGQHRPGGPGGPQGHPQQPQA